MVLIFGWLDYLYKRNPTLKLLYILDIGVNKLVVPTKTTLFDRNDNKLSLIQRVQNWRKLLLFVFDINIFSERILETSLNFTTEITLKDTALSYKHQTEITLALVISWQFLYSVHTSDYVFNKQINKTSKYTFIINQMKNKIERKRNTTWSDQFQNQISNL